MQPDAITRLREPGVDLSAALNASGVLGAWSWSARSDRCTLDAGAAEALAGDPTLAGRPVPFETANARVHPDDRPALLRRFHALRDRGGLFVAEYRAVSPAGGVRRILWRGRVAGGASNRRHGHGIVIDVTDAAPGAGPDLGPLSDTAAALIAAVDRAIDCRAALDGVPDPELHLLADMLLLRLGHSVGSASGGAGAWRGH